MPVVATILNGVGLPQDETHAQAVEACNSAIDALAAAMGVLQGDMTEAERAIVNYYFFLGGDEPVPQQVINVLAATRAAIMQSNITVVIGWFNWVNAATQPHTINLSRAVILRQQDRVRLFIHEATHLYAQTLDHHERGYCSTKAATAGNYRAPGLTAAESLVNADSFAFAAVRLAGIPIL